MKKSWTLFVIENRHFKVKLFFLLSGVQISFRRLTKVDATSNRLLVETYSETALSVGNYRKWFQKFKNGEFDFEDKERSGRLKVYEDAELKALLD